MPIRTIRTPAEDPAQDRRNDFDVTNTIQVSAPQTVCREVIRIYESLYAESGFDALRLAFHDFERYFTGRSQDYHAVDTTYHDIQHTLDMTLCTARLVAGHDLTVERQDRLGAERAMLAVVTSLFHDFGYLRHKVHDRNSSNGAEFTRSHVTRSGRFLEQYLPAVGLEQFVPVVFKIVHFTGYELHPEKIELDEPKDSIVGHLIGTADLLAQMSDRCYLEKCRDRLYPEFVLGEVALSLTKRGLNFQYTSGRDLLTKTLGFYRSSAKFRLERVFNRSYRYLEAYFDNGENPYIRLLGKNLVFLKRVIEQDAWESLRRHPPCVVPDPQGEARVIAFAMKHLREVSEQTRQRDPAAP